MKRLCLVCFVASVATIGDIGRANEVLFESGTLGPTGFSLDELVGDIHGAVVSDFVFNGVRFELTQPAISTRIGGHFVDDPRTGNSFFGAIVHLDGSSDFPDSGDLSTPDVLGATLLTFTNPSAEVFGDLELQLDPGWYALVFGSGLFGATGTGGALLNNPDIGSPTYIGWQPGAVNGWGNLINPIFRNYRLVVEGRIVPEPTAVSLIQLGSIATLLVRLSTRRSPRFVRSSYGA